MSIRLILLILMTGLFICLYPNIGHANIHISAKNGVLMDLKTGKVLYEKQAHDKESVASLTKVMTAIVAIESNQLQEKTKASRRAIYTEGSSIYLEQGESMTIEDLTYGLMLRSGNDAAVAIAEHIGGSVEGFVYLMNEKAQWLGMTQTNFANPHGLEADEHYSTAYDLAVLMRYAMNSQIFKEITSTKKYLSNSRSYYWMNKNKLLTHLYEYCTGGKTGYTKKAGRTLLTTAQKDDTHLIAVTLNAANDWQDHTRLFEWGFEHLERLEKENNEYTPDQIIPSSSDEILNIDVNYEEEKQTKNNHALFKADDGRVTNESNNFLEQIKVIMKKIIIFRDDRDD